MTERQLRESLKKGELRNQYLLAGEEPLLIDRALDMIKNAVHAEATLDTDTFSLPDVGLEGVMEKLFLMPFGSKQRLIIVKDLEEVLASELNEFARAISRNSSGNCLVLVYRLKRDSRAKKQKLKELHDIFSNAEDVFLGADSRTVKRWIQAKVKRDGLKISDSLIEYLEKEFSNDVTGLKNEFNKIDNYLYEAGNINRDGMRDLAKGLCDLSKYQVVNALMKGRSDTLQIFEELEPSLPSSAVLVDALTRGIVYRACGKDGVTQTNRATLVEVVEQLVTIDRGIKTSSIFERLLMELFILRNAGAFKNGVLYGR
jgi:DNA polymerase III delta subunit